MVKDFVCLPLLRLVSNFALINPSSPLAINESVLPTT